MGVFMCLQRHTLTNTLQKGADLRPLHITGLSHIFVLLLAEDSGHITPVLGCPLLFADIPQHLLELGYHHLASISRHALNHRLQNSNTVFVNPPLYPATAQGCCDPSPIMVVAILQFKLMEVILGHLLQAKHFLFAERIVA